MSTRPLRALDTYIDQGVLVHPPLPEGVLWWRLRAAVWTAGGLTNTGVGVDCPEGHSPTGCHTRFLVSGSEGSCRGVDPQARMG